MASKWAERVKLAELVTGASATLFVATVCAMQMNPATPSAPPQQEPGYLQGETIASGLPAEPAAPGPCACGDHKTPQAAEPTTQTPLAEPSRPEPPPRRAKPCECPEGCPCAHCAGKARDCFCADKKTFADKTVEPESRGVIDRLKNLFGGSNHKAKPEPAPPAEEPSKPRPATSGRCECPEGCPCAHCSGKQRDCACER